jgi:hypothetical protein
MDAVAMKVKYAVKNWVIAGRPKRQVNLPDYSSPGNSSDY